MQHHTLPTDPHIQDIPNQLEDKVLKTAAMFFGQDLLPYLGVKERITGIVPTEQVHLELRRMEEDFNYMMEDGSLRHLEFESDRITSRDLRRFREYEAYLSLVYNCPVITTVLCTSRVRPIKQELITGINVYRIQVIRIKDRNADKIFRKAERKLKKGKHLTSSDLFPILLTPLMSGSMEECMRICRGLDILKSDQVAVSKEDLRRMEAMLYALAIKFLDKTDLRKVKEKINMTLLGQMLMEDGIEKGEMTKLISLVMKKMKKGLSPEETAELLEESPDCISRIYAAVQANPELDENGIFEFMKRTDREND
ncbi:MAG: hypothetical protein LUK37_01175 [Clostridia bacterium]|nr:hypothetical protein [Clostridia bacterium]